jgi:aspartate racemase
MKHIGIIGGLSPESTAEYYITICNEFNSRVGGLHFPRMTIASMDLQQVADMQEVGDWPGVAAYVGAGIQDLASAGAELVGIATNTVHNAYELIAEQAPAGVEVLSIMDATAAEINRDGIQKVGLLGTEATMKYGFFQDRLAEHGIEAIIPYEDDREYVNSVIWDELVKGQFTEEARAGYMDVIGKLQWRGAQGIILGCTEIPLLIKPEDTVLPMYNTTEIHAMALLDKAMAT